MTEMRSDTGEVLLEVRDLRVSFASPEGDVPAVENVGFEVRRGETLVVIGESGSGKSVSASVVMNILDRPPGRIETGSVRFEGIELLTLDRRRRREVNGARLAMIFQDPLAYLNPVYSVGWQISEVLRIHSRDAEAAGFDARTRALELLGRVGIPDAAERFDQYPHQFSGGQRQRVMIAMALALAPDVLIADEPTTALDVTVQRQILDLLRDLQREQGMAIVLITHDLSVAAQMADRVVVMKNGRVVESGALRDVVSSPQHPYTRQLLGAIATLEAPKRSHPAAGRGARPLLEVSGLRKEYRVPAGLFRRAKPLLAVDDVNFTLEAGTTLGVVGESGSGKSSLARVLMGLEVPTGGQARFDGADLFAMSPEESRRFHREVQMIFQDPFGSLNPKMTVEEIVSEPLAIQGDILLRDAWRPRVEELLELVGLDRNHRLRNPHQFSGGQRQRIAIARALASNPRLIICDEAVSALDVQIQAQIVALLADLRDRLGLSYIFITHDLPVVRSLADRIIVMKDGRIVEEGETEALFHAPQHPYTRELLHASEIPSWMSDGVRNATAQNREDHLPSATDRR